METYNQKDEKGRFKKGSHWREPKPYWDKKWLAHEYLENKKSASQIANEQGCCENNILAFLKKHQIKTRTTSEVRKIKKWGSFGKKNPMYGRNGIWNSNWKGGITPERQSFYASLGWAKAGKKVWKRDKGRCQRCGIQPKKRSTFHIHHITPFNFKEKRLELSNLILLCKRCHNFIHSKKNTKKELINDLF